MHTDFKLSCFCIFVREHPKSRSVKTWQTVKEQSGLTIFSSLAEKMRMKFLYYILHLLSRLSANYAYHALTNHASKSKIRMYVTFWDQTVYNIVGNESETIDSKAQLKTAIVANLIFRAVYQTNEIRAQKSFLKSFHHMEKDFY